MSNVGGGDVFALQIRETVVVDVGQAEKALIESMRNVAAEAERLSKLETGGGGGAGPTTAGAYASSELNTLRTDMERQIAASGLSGGDAGKWRGMFTRVLGTHSKLPEELRPHIEAASYQTQKQVRDAVAQQIRQAQQPVQAPIGGTGHLPGPDSAKAPSTSGVPPRGGGGGGGTAKPPTGGDDEDPEAVRRKAAAKAAGDATERARRNAQALADLQENGEWAKERAKEVRRGYALHADVVENLAAVPPGEKTGEYAQSRARATSGQAEINAQQQRLLAVDGNYARARANTVRDLSIQQAASQQLLAADGTYTRAQAVIARAKAEQQAKIQTAVASDDRYSAAQAVVTRARAKQQEKIQGALALDDHYRDAQANIIRSKAQQAARVAGSLEFDTKYAQSQAAVTRSKTVQQAMIQAELGASTPYLRAQQIITRVRAEQQSSIQSSLATDERYIGAQQGIARAKAEQQAKIQSGLVGDDRYNTAQQDIARAKAEQSARLQTGLVGDDRYNAAQVNIARAKAQQGAQLQGALAIDDRYLRATADSTVARAATGAQVQELLAKDGIYAQAQERVAVAKAEQSARIQSELAINDRYLRATAETSVARAAQQAQINEQLAGDNVYAEAQARLATAKAQQQARTQEALASDTRYAEATARAAAARDRVATQEAQARLAPANVQADTARQLAEQRLAATQGLAASQGLLAEHQADPTGSTIALQAARKSAAEEASRQRDLIIEQNRSEAAAVQLSAQLAQAREQRVTLEKAATAGISAQQGETLASVRGRTAAAEQATVAEQRAVTAREILANQRGELDIIVQQKALERRLNQEIESQVRQANVAQNGGQIGPGGGLFQRLQAFIQARQSGDVVDPTRLMGLGQFITSRTLTTVGFAASGAALYGTVRTIKEMVTEAEQLDQVSAQVRAQFDALGRGNQFEGFRTQMLGIARDTGTAGQEVLQIGAQMQGAFQDPTVAISQTREALEAMKVTGLTGADALNTFIAMTKTFGTSVADVSDEALSLQDHFGIAAKEIINASSQIAPIAQQMGLSQTELMGMVAAAAQATGKSTQSVAEGFGRILPEVQKSAGPMLEMFRQIPALSGDFQKVTQDFASGNEGQALKLLFEHWKDLSGAQRTAFFDMIGGRKNAQDLAAALNEPDQLIKAMNGDYTETGRTAQSFAAYQNSLAGILARVGEEMRQIGDALARSGALDGLKALAGGVLGAITLLAGMLRAVDDLNKALGGWPGRIAAVALAFKGLELAIKAVIEAQKLLSAVSVATNRLIGPPGGGGAPIPPIIPGGGPTVGGGGGVIGAAEELVVPAAAVAAAEAAPVAETVAEAAAPAAEAAAPAAAGRFALEEWQGPRQAPPRYYESGAGQFFPRDAEADIRPALGSTSGAWVAGAHPYGTRAAAVPDVAEPFYMGQQRLNIDRLQREAEQEAAQRPAAELAAQQVSNLPVLPVAPAETLFDAGAFTDFRAGIQARALAAQEAERARLAAQQQLEPGGEQLAFDEAAAAEQVAKKRYVAPAAESVLPSGLIIPGGGARVAGAEAGAAEAGLSAEARQVAFSARMRAAAAGLGEQQLTSLLPGEGVGRLARWTGARGVNPAPLAGFFARIGNIGMKNVPGTGALSLPGFGGAIGVGGTEGIASSGWLAAGSASLGLATAGLGAADLRMIQEDQKQFARLHADRADAAKTNADTFQGEDVRQLLANRDIYRKPKGLAGVRESVGDFLGGKLSFGGLVRGRTAAETQQQQATQAETVREFDAAVDQGAFSALPKDEIDRLRKQVDSSQGKKGAAEAQKKLLALSRTQYAGVRQAADAAKRIDQTQKDAAAGNTTLQLQTVQTIQEQLNAGQTSLPEAVSAIRQQIQDLRGADPSGTNKNIQSQLGQALSALQSIEQQAISDQVSLAQTIAQGTGQQTGAPMLAAVVGAINQFGEGTPGTPGNMGLNAQGIPNSIAAPGTQSHPQSDLTPEEQLQLGQQGYQAGYQTWQDQISHAGSAAQALDIAKAGAAVDPAVRAQLEKAYEDKWHEKLNLPDYQASPEQIEQLSQNALNEQVSGIQLSTAQRSDTLDPAVAAKMNQAIAQATLTNAQNLPDTDPTKITKVNQAQLGVIQANQAAANIPLEIMKAQVEYNKALLPDDRIAQARASQQEADIAAKEAHGKAAQLQALAQRAAADRQMQDAMFDISQSQVKLLQTQAQVAGNVIEAANYGVQLAQNELDKAVREKADPGKIADLQGQVDSAKGNLRDVTLQNTEDTIQFNLDMRRITIGQAIEQLNALLSIANPQQQMDLLRRIQQLREQAGQDMQFNIPSDIKLPTLYEVRRAQQTGTSGYQDNRQVSVVMHINNGMDQQSATKWLTDTVGRSTRVTSGSRRV